MRKNVLIMGAAGRDFHNFNLLFKDNPNYRVRAFTATQIPLIAERFFAQELAGSLYPAGIPIYPEEELAGLIRNYSIDLVVFSYSDISHVESHSGKSFGEKAGHLPRILKYFPNLLVLFFYYILL